MAALPLRLQSLPVKTLSLFAITCVSAGYAFSRVVSLEAQAALGRATLGPRPCCSATNYWLGSDGAVYYAPVDGMEGWDYSSLKSRVAPYRRRRH